MPVDLILQIMVSRVDFIKGPLKEGLDIPISGNRLKVIAEIFDQKIETTTQTITPFLIAELAAQLIMAFLHTHRQIEPIFKILAGLDPV